MPKGGFKPGFVFLEASSDKRYQQELVECENGDNYYGALKKFSGHVNILEWLKMQACQTKEPSYTSYTNIKGTVDYIFYESDGLFEVVRTLDVPSYSKYLKNNISCLPHALMPSDHLSILAEFILL